MTIQDIADRLNDVANALEKDPDYLHSAIGFLRATAQRMIDDAELEQKIALVKYEHELMILCRKNR